MNFKKLFPLLLAFVPMMVSAQTYPIAIDDANFPDANFRKYLLAKDYGKDGVLTEEEINGIKDLSISRAGIGNLKGIEFFTALTVLVCYGNQLTALDVSKNTKLVHLNCSKNQLTSLDVSKNLALTELECADNHLTSLDVSKHTELVQLWCYKNCLRELNVSKNTKLTHLNCYINCLTTLDVSKNTALTYLGCSQNGIKGAAMDDFINGLPKKTADQDCTLEIYNDSDENEGNECSASQVAAIKAKGWIPMFFNGTEWENF